MGLRRADHAVGHDLDDVEHPAEDGAHDCGQCHEEIADVQDVGGKGAHHGHSRAEHSGHDLEDLPDAGEDHADHAADEVKRRPDAVDGFLDSGAVHDARDRVPDRLESPHGHVASLLGDVPEGLRDLLELSVDVARGPEHGGLDDVRRDLALRGDLLQLAHGETHILRDPLGDLRGVGHDDVEVLAPQHTSGECLSEVIHGRGDAGRVRAGDLKLLLQGLHEGRRLVHALKGVARLGFQGGHGAHHLLIRSAGPLRCLVDHVLHTRGLLQVAGDAVDARLDLCQLVGQLHGSLDRLEGRKGSRSLQRHLAERSCSPAGVLHLLHDLPQRRRGLVYDLEYLMDPSHELTSLLSVS